MYGTPSTGIAGWAYLVIGGAVLLFAAGSWLVRNAILRPFRALKRRLGK